MPNTGGKPKASPKPRPGEKKVNRDYCFRHQLMYEGYECPRCADGDLGSATPKTAAGGGASAGPRARAAGATGVAEVEQAQVVTPESRSESAARSQDAQHLLAAGAVRDALAAAEKAITLDPANLEAYVVGARASQRLGDFSRQSGFLEEAARLLRGPAHRNSIVSFLEVVKSTNDATHVRPVISTFVSAGHWKASDALVMVRMLVSRQFAGEALRVIEMLEPADRSLALTAYNSKITSRGFAMADPEIEQHLARIPAAARERVIEEYREVCDDPVLGMTSLMTVRDAVRNWYGQRAGDIGQLLEEEGRKQASEFLAPDVVKPASAAGIRIGAIAGGVLALGGLAVGGGVIGLIVGLAIGVVAGAAAFVMRKETELHRRLPDLVPVFKEKLQEEEADRWRSILEEELAHGEEPGAAPAAEEAAPTTPERADSSEDQTGA